MNINQLDLTDFGSPTIDEAFEVIKAESMNIIYCALTGARVGIIDDHELKLCLQMEMSRKPLASVNDLVRAFELRFHVYSSGAAPSLRVHKDNKSIVYMLRNDPAGHNRLFTYLAGRLFFTALTPERLHNSVEFGIARLTYLIELMNKLNDLGEGWEHSLEPKDEEQIKESNVTLLPAGENERKAAAASLDLMLRLDGIHNIRHLLYDQAIRQRLINMRDVSDTKWSFTHLQEVLTATEADGLLRLARASQRDVSGNSMVITALLERLRVSSNRAQTYMTDFEKVPLHRLKEGTAGGKILADISNLLSQNRISKKDRQYLESAKTQLLIEGEKLSWGDKRLDALNRQYARDADSKGNVIIRKGDAATKAMAESYLAKGIALRPELKAEMERIIAEGTVKVNKAVREAIEEGKPLSVKSNAPQKKFKTVAQARNHALFTNLLKPKESLAKDVEALPDFMSFNPEKKD